MRLLSSRTRKIASQSARATHAFPESLARMREKQLKEGTTELVF